MNITNKDHIRNVVFSNIDSLIDIICGNKKCKMCSNYYFDGDIDKCHAQINQSDCKSGVREYLNCDRCSFCPSVYNKKYERFECAEDAIVAENLLNQFRSLLDLDIKVCKDCDRSNSCSGICPEFFISLERKIDSFFSTFEKPPKNRIMKILIYIVERFDYELTDLFGIDVHNELYSMISEYLLKEYN